MKTDFFNFKYPAAGAILAGIITCSIPTVAANNSSQEINNKIVYKKNLATDVFEKKCSVPPQGTDDPEVLSKAPTPNVVIMGKTRKARIVVDLTTNVLYTYDKIGNVEKAYSIASGRISGKDKSPTTPGVKIVTHTEKSPYSNAYGTKRKQNPQDYGPMCIILRKLDPKTGETSQTGEFIHGNNNPNSIGKYASGGCMRMDNNVIQEIAPKMKSGDIVVVKKNKKLK